MGKKAIRRSALLAVLTRLNARGC